MRDSGASWPTQEHHDYPGKGKERATSPDRPNSLRRSRDPALLSAREFLRDAHHLLGEAREILKCDSVNDVKVD